MKLLTDWHNAHLKTWQEHGIDPVMHERYMAFVESFPEVVREHVAAAEPWAMQFAELVLRLYQKNTEWR